MESIKIADREISDAREPFLIAEIGNNHDGSLDQAMQLVEAAAAAGADAVKFQTYDPDRLVRRDHELHEFFSRFALPRQWHEPLRDAAQNLNLMFLSTPFDEDSAAYLAAIGVPALKIASSDLTNASLIRTCAAHGLPLLLSTGMASLDEVKAAVKEARKGGSRQTAVLHCVSLYPTPVEQAELLAVPVLRSALGIPVGFSDHSLSTALPVAAVALGARIIEKHFTVDRSLPGPDHCVALQPEEFALMARGCREAFAALGRGGKTISAEIEQVRRRSLRGLYAAEDIPAGAALEVNMIAQLRPAASLTSADLHMLAGRVTARAIKAGEEIKLEMFAEELDPEMLHLQLESGLLDEEEGQ